MYIAVHDGRSFYSTWTAAATCPASTRSILCCRLINYQHQSKIQWRLLWMWRLPESCRCCVIVIICRLLMFAIHYSMLLLSLLRLFTLLICKSKKNITYILSWSSSLISSSSYHITRWTCKGSLFVCTSCMNIPGESKNNPFNFCWYFSNAFKFLNGILHNR